MIYNRPLFHLGLNLPFKPGYHLIKLALTGKEMIEKQKRKSESEVR